MMRIGFTLILLLCLLRPALAAVSASLDRDRVALGETVTLTLSATDGDSIGQPDLSALEPDFRILGQSSSSNIRIVNGSMSSSKSLAIQLMPKHLGSLTIPALTTASGNTSPLSLTVDNSGASTSNSNGQATSRDLFVEASVSPKQVYVGQQATVTLKLYYAINIDNGSLDNLSVSNATVQPLGKPQRFNANRNGRAYQVYEQQYALFPSDSGKLSIPAVTFQGQVLTSATTNFFGMQVPGFGTPTPVTAASNPLTLDVKPIPVDWKGLWLPAHKITLGMSGLPADDTLTVGTPLNLRLSLSALGLPVSSLPDLKLQDMDNASVYADKADSNTSQSGDLVKGEKNRTFAILPQHPGSLTLPATRLTWFNTSSGKAETITLPARTFKVVAAGGNTGTPTQQPAAPSAATGNNDTSTPVSSGHWKLAFFASLGLWLLLVIILLWRTRARRPTAPTTHVEPKRRNARQRCLQQLKQQDRQALASLLAWAGCERNITTLNDLKQALAPHQSDLLARLEGWCYAGRDFPADAPAGFRNGLEWRTGTDGKNHTPDPFAPLYPTGATGGKPRDHNT